MTGKSFGASGTVLKEVVFNTSLSGCVRLSLPFRPLFLSPCEPSFIQCAVRLKSHLWELVYAPTPGAGHCCELHGGRVRLLNCPCVSLKGLPDGSCHGTGQQR